MSSHHIIREKQEPALLVLGLDSFTDELLGQLLEWSPTLMVTADTAEQVNAYGIKFDVLIDDAEPEYLQEDVKLISHESGSVTEAALQYLVVNGYPAVNVVADAVVLNDYLPYADKLNIVLLSGGKKIFPITTGFTKWKPAGELIEVMSGADELVYTGLKYIVGNQYQTVADGFFTLHFTNPYLFIAESIV